MRRMPGRTWRPMAKDRLDKVLVHLNLGSRTEIKALIRKGRVSVDGQVATDSGVHVDPQTAEIRLDGEPVTFRRHYHVLLHKPGGVITANDDPRTRTVMDVLPAALHFRGLFPVGRLDKDTEGLLLLTTDGELGHRLLSPKWHVDKRYYVRLDRPLGPDDPEAFAKGIALDDGYVCMPARLIRLSAAADEAEVIIQEGKYHQVKRMFGARGNYVTYLKRVQMGPLTLGDLPTGEARLLTDAEAAALYASSGLAQA